MKPAVVATIQKQPNANTLEVTERIEQTLANLKATLPPDVTINTKAFQQADFIKRAVGNVQEALIEGGVLVMSYFGITVNTMTLGGLAIAIGALVDDAIIDVENVFRRLKQNARRATPEPVARVVYKASSEIRNS